MCIWSVMQASHVQQLPPSAHMETSWARYANWNWTLVIDEKICILLVGISPLLRAEAQTLARPEHKEEFNDNKKKRDNNSIYFKVFSYIYYQLMQEITMNTPFFWSWATIVVLGNGPVAPWFWSPISSTASCQMGDGSKWVWSKLNIHHGEWRDKLRE